MTERQKQFRLANQKGAGPGSVARSWVKVGRGRGVVSIVKHNKTEREDVNEKVWDSGLPERKGDSHQTTGSIKERASDTIYRSGPNEADN